MRQIEMTRGQLIAWGVMLAAMVMTAFGVGICVGYGMPWLFWLAGAFVFASGVVAGMALSPLSAVGGRLDRIEGLLQASAEREEQTMRSIEVLQAEIDKANATTNEMAATTQNIAADIERIKSQIADGATGEELQALLAQLEAHGATLTAQSDALKAVAAIVPEDAEG